MSRMIVDRWIDRYAARVRLGEFLERGAECGAAYLFGFGAAVLVVKLFVPQAWPHVLWLAAGLVPAMALVWWRTGSSRESRWQSAARLDGVLSAGGLLMTLTEQPDENWSDRLPQLEQSWREAIPRIRPRRFTGYLALPLLFALGACLVPLRESASASPRLNSVGQQAARELEELLLEIGQDRVLDDEEQRQLQEEVQKLAEETRDTPLTHEKWETVDALRERMKVRLESAAMSLAQARDAAATLARAGRTDAPELSPETAERLEKELAGILQKLGQKGALAGAPESLNDELKRLMKNGRLRLPQDPGERQALLDELRDYLDRENDKLTELRKKCANCRSGQCTGEGECEGGQCQADGSGNRPGRGGVTRGRGDADLTWGDEAEKQGAKFKETVLPPGFLDQPKEDVVGIRTRDPGDEAPESVPRADRRDPAAAAGETTWNRRLSPRHRYAVRRYFDNPATKRPHE